MNHKLYFPTMSLKSKFLLLPIVQLLLLVIHSVKCQTFSTTSSSVPPCASNFCLVNLSTDLTMRYRIHLPNDRTIPIDDECKTCKITMQMIYNGGYSWLGIGLAGGVKSGSPMIGAHAIVGQPGISDPATFYLGGKDAELIRRTELHVGESTIDFIGGRTVMEFTIALEDWRGSENTGIHLYGPSSFIWAHGKDGETELNYHGPENKSTFTINNILESQSDNENDNNTGNGSSYGDEIEQEQSHQTMSRTSKSTKSAWLAHGIMAFLAFGIFVPTAISTALLRDCTLSDVLGAKKMMEVLQNRVLSKYWLYIHIGLNTTASALTMIVFSVAVSNVNREGGSSHWMNAHSKMGLAMFILVLCQVLGGYFRPSAAAKAMSDETSSEEKVDNDLVMAENEEGDTHLDVNDISNDDDKMNNEEYSKTLPMKSVVRQSWELLHNILGIALFLFGVWQMYEGIELYHRRYNNSSFTAVAFFYFLWMGLWICIIIGAIVFKLFFRKEGVPNGRIDGAAVENKVVEIPGKSIEQPAENASEFI